MSSQVETAVDRLQALGAFDKSAVDAAELSGQEIARVLVRLGLGAPELAVKLTNGACAANYRCVLRDGPPVVLKACVGDDCRELADVQLDVLSRLAKASPGVAPALRSLNAVDCTTTTGRPACAVAMALAPGRACNLLVDDGELPESAACELVGAALAGVHASPVDDDDDLPAIEGDGWIERYARCAAPLDAYVGAGRPWDPAEPTGFVRWVPVHESNVAAHHAIDAMPARCAPNSPIDLRTGGRSSTAVAWSAAARRSGTRRRSCRPGCSTGIRIRTICCTPWRRAFLRSWTGRMLEEAPSSSTSRRRRSGPASSTIPS